MKKGLYHVLCFHKSKMKQGFYEAEISDDQYPQYYSKLVQYSKYNFHIFSSIGMKTNIKSPLI